MRKIAIYRMSSFLSMIHILAWLKVWHAGKSPKYRAFLLPKFRKNSWKNEGWHWGILGLWLDLNPHKEKFWSEYRSKYRQISIFSAKNSIQSFGLGFSGFHEMWKRWIESFLFSPKQMIECLSAICEPFLTASVAGRETTPPRAIEAAVSDLCGVWSGRTV